MVQQQANVSSNELFPTRTIARPIKNLGNTCYMNAVLQALAHAPELCLAMDCEPHHISCPIAAENYARQKREEDAAAAAAAASDESSPLSSPDNTGGGAGSNGNGNGNNNNAASRKTAGTRKSLRSGRKSPQEVEETRRRRMQFCALCEVESHVKQVHDAALKDKPVAPSTFVDGFIDFVAPWFKPGLQEDSHEFLRLLIDAMQKSCEKARISAQDDNPQDDASPISSSSDAAPGEKDSEYPFSLFRGTVESNVTCESCKASSSTLDPIEDIGLEVTMPNSSHTALGGAPFSNMSTSRMDRSSRNNSPIPTPTPALANVQTAFQRFARAEPLDAGYKCEKCGLVGRATKQSRLASIPPILTLHLKRFRYGAEAAAIEQPVSSRRTGRSSEVGQLLGANHSDFKSGSAKIEGNVQFNELFNITPYLTDELQAKHKRGMFCRLFAVIVHSGKNSHSGHYISYVRSLSKNATKSAEWWKMDDGRVTLASLNEVLRSEAYMLFYRVVNHPVSERLVQENKDKVAATVAALNEERTKQATADSTASASESTSAIMTRSRASRKRSAPPPAFEDGEEWARAKTKIPPSIYGHLKKAQEKLSGDVSWTKDFLQLLLEEAAKEDSRLGKSPMAYVDDLEGGADAVRKQLSNLFKGLAGVFEQEDAMGSLLPYLKLLHKNGDDASNNTTTTTTKITTSITAASASTGSDEKFVAVVEPEEDLLL